MQQLTQELKSGKMEIIEVPFPALGDNNVLVRNHYSVISAGTEGKTVSDARKGYIAKARSRQKEVKQVIDMIKTSGLMNTYNLVMNKLDTPAALGYSCAGEVIAVGANVKEFRVGDKVACGGVTACHADVVSVPVNLCVKVPNNVELNHAAFTTIAAIAIQGIRQTELKVGESALIIGMGLIGQLTSKILTAAGIKSIGVDVNDDQVELAKRSGIENVFIRNQPGLEDYISEFSNGYGVDAAIITAGTSSLDPVDFAGSVCRKKGKVVIVGAVPTGFNRVNYFKKELDLRMFSLYGPGRYDSNYEDKGIDYPIAYVRWTENRNMQSFLELLSSNAIDVNPLISHVFNLENATDAYDLILSKKENYNGIVIKYDETKTVNSSVVLNNKVYPKQDINIGIIGAGNFAQNILLPKMKGKCNFVGIATSRGNIARFVADKYKFSYCAEKADDVLKDSSINTLFITTRHDTHAKFVLEAIKNGKNVFVEKPLAINEEELMQIKDLYYSTNNSSKLMIGFNRRFSPAVKALKKLFINSHAKTLNIRVNSGVLPADHWTNDPLVGGGRIIGEGCHFIDLAIFLSGGTVTSVSAVAMDDQLNINSTVAVSLKFSNGSIASINYFSNGSKKLNKEYIEVFCGGTAAIIDDFTSLTIYDKSVKKIEYKTQDKGHDKEIEEFFATIKNGNPSPITFDECFHSSMVTFKVMQSIKEKRLIEIH